MTEADIPEQVTEKKIGQRMNTSLDQLVQILEISFIFLLIFSLIALVDTTVSELNLYGPISDQHLGERNVGSLSGGNWEAIVRVTLVFNFLLFGFSLFFGLWMRRTRDGWTWDRLGYTFSTAGYSFRELVRRAILLGLIAIIIHFTTVMVIHLTNGVSLDHALVYFNEGDDSVFTPRQLRAEYYFGFVEMGFIWPLSAGFFFFAYAHSSLAAKFPTGVANLLSTAFYVFYLQFFFLIPQPNKLTIYLQYLADPFTNAGFWIMSAGLFLILYINFSAFAETGSIVLPFLLNFVYNVGITIVQAANALIYDEVNPAMFIPYILIILIIIGWYFYERGDFSTIKMGLQRLKDVTEIRMRILVGYVLLFIVLSFIIPAITNDLLYYANSSDSTGAAGWVLDVFFITTTAGISLQSWVIPILYAFNFILLIVMATTVLTYEPTEVFDVLLVNKSGTPIASHIEIFETDDVLISGFFTALSAVDEELSSDGGLRSIKRGEREIIIEDGVFSRIIALVDSDHPSIRQTITTRHRQFEINHKDRIEGLPGGTEFEEANELVKELGDLEVTFNVPNQTRWITSVSLALAPVMIVLIGLL